MTFNSKRIVDIHEELLKHHKIEPGFKDKNLLDSILYKMNARISKQELYPTIFQKAASLFEGIIRLHPFIDGNKRTALASVQEYLLENEVIFVIPLSAVRFAVKIAQHNRMGQDDIESLVNNIKNWIEDRSINLRNPTNIMRITAQDAELIASLEKISAKREDESILENTIDYWIAKDIYPESDFTFEQLMDFLEERMGHLLTFLEMKVGQIEKKR